MKPSEYKAQYESLNVHLGDGQTTTVRINKYRLGQPKDGGAARNALMNKVGAKGIEDFELRVGAGTNLEPVDAEFTKKPAFRTILASPFTGKGAPQHCQIVLQLVKQFGLGTDLQKYADDNLGLDCNGFVGNYLWHEWRGNSWRNPGRTDADRDGPDTSVDGFNDVRRKNRVRRWSDINATLLYLFIRTTENGDIITNRSGDPIGHIVISDVGYPPLAATEADGHIGVRVVESTASHNPPGLSENWYSCLEEKNPGTIHAYFQVDRGADFLRNRKIWFLIARVDPVAMT